MFYSELSEASLKSNLLMLRIQLACCFTQIMKCFNNFSYFFVLFILISLLHQSVVVALIHILRIKHLIIKQIIHFIPHFPFYLISFMTFKAMP